LFQMCKIETAYYGVRLSIQLSNKLSTMQSTTVVPVCLNMDEFVSHPKRWAHEILAFSKDVADKFESQEKEIDYLKKNALAQEIKINDLSKLVDVLIVAPRKGSVDCSGRDPVALRAWCEIMQGGGEYTETEKQTEINAVISERNMNCFMGSIAKHGHKIILAKEQEIRNAETARIAEVARLRVEAQEKLKAEELAEKKEKAMKDMMARVTLLEETAKKEEDELENLKLVSEPKTDEEIEDPEIQELLMREANALARAAEMRAEKAKLRGTKKSKTKTSIDPSTWSDAKCAQMSDGWCE
jgi:hypothetical protein